MPTPKQSSTNATRAGTPGVTAEALGLVVGSDPITGSHDLLQPVLLLHGGSKCNVLLEAPVIQNVALPGAYLRDAEPDNPGQERQVKLEQAWMLIYHPCCDNQGN